MRKHRNDRPRGRRSLVILILIAAATTILGLGFGASDARSSSGADAPGTARTAMLPTAGDLATPAGRMVRDLTSGHPDRVAGELPPDFTTDLGYRPRVVAGYPVNPSGGCSSPVTLPRRFEVLCRSHDFGYDVLRYAAETGHPLGGWARLRLDRQLVDRMHASCTYPLCDAAATATEVALRLNTWRQYDGPPTAVESATQIVSSGVGRGWADLLDRRADTPQ
ncbi:hypothetical protein ACPXCG_09910 [Gordonia sp. DT218]|uniref:hypothetical protein n=1 Tax=Gordonia sp. DT218 TaxID=3416659 RepID=UPI003CE9CEC7